jgi:drug/metabolite transporter (DMT)-like permease
MGVLLIGRSNGLFKALFLATLVLSILVCIGSLLQSHHLEAVLSGIILAVGILLIGALQTINHPKNEESILRMLFYGLQNGLGWFLFTTLATGAYTYTLQGLHHIMLAPVVGLLVMVACFSFTAYTNYRERDHISLQHNGNECD